jgi:hypothetical protein
VLVRDYATLFKYCKLSRYSRNELSISGVQLMFLLYASLDFKKQEGIVSTDKLQQKEFPFKLTHKISKNTYFRLNFRFLFETKQLVLENTVNFRAAKFSNQLRSNYPLIKHPVKANNSLTALTCHS